MGIGTRWPQSQKGQEQEQAQEHMQEQEQERSGREQADTQTGRHISVVSYDIKQRFDMNLFPKSYPSCFSEPYDLPQNRFPPNLPCSPQLVDFQTILRHCSNSITAQHFHRRPMTCPTCSQTIVHKYLPKPPNTSPKHPRNFEFVKFFCPGGCSMCYKVMGLTKDYVGPRQYSDQAIQGPSQEEFDQQGVAMDCAVCTMGLKSLRIMYM